MLDLGAMRNLLGGAFSVHAQVICGGYRSQQDLFMGEIAAGQTVARLISPSAASHAFWLLVKLTPKGVVFSAAGDFRHTMDRQTDRPTDRKTDRQWLPMSSGISPYNRTSRWSQSSCGQ